TDTPVDFFDHITVQSSGTVPAKIVGNKQGDMWQVVRNIQEEWLALVLGNKLYCFFGIPSGNGMLICRAFNDLFIPHQRYIEVLDRRVHHNHSTWPLADAIHIV